MLFVNLLPKIKIEFIRIKKIKRFLSGMLIIVAPLCIAIVGLLYYQVNISNPQQIKDLDDETSQVIGTIKSLAASVIDSDEQDDSDKPDLGFDKIITIRNQLEALGDLHKLKPEVERLFSFHQLHYLDSLIPEDLGTYEQVNFNFLDETFSITGQTYSLSTGIQLRDSLLYIGLKEGCTLENRDTRGYPITLTSFPSLRAAVRNTDDALALNYSITGSFASENPDDPELFQSIALRYSRIGQEHPSAYKDKTEYKETIQNLDEYFQNLTLVTPEIISSNDFDAKPTHSCKNRIIQTVSEG